MVLSHIRVTLWVNGQVHNFLHSSLIYTSHE